MRISTYASTLGAKACLAAQSQSACEASPTLAHEEDADNADYTPGSGMGAFICRIAHETANQIQMRRLTRARQRLALPFFLCALSVGLASAPCAAAGAAARSDPTGAAVACTRVPAVSHAPGHGLRVGAGQLLGEPLTDVPDRLLWSQGGTVSAAARAMLQSLHAASDYGLRASDYGGDALAAQLAALGAEPAASAQWQQFDTALSNAVLLFIHDLHCGRVDPRAAGFDMPARRETFDARARLEQLAAAPDPNSVLAAVEPNFLHYRLLRQALAHYRQLAATAGLTALPPLPGRTLAPGQSYRGAPALRRLLAALGDLPPQYAASEDPTLDAALVAALKDFQYLHGLREDGALGRSSYAALTVPLAQRVRQIELTLERWRWLPPLQGPTIVVNIPQFRLFMFSSPVDTEAQMLRMNVIVGQQYPRLNTPVFAAEMNAVVFRPYWDVPPSITQHELLPLLRARPHYLETENMEMVGADAAHPLLAVTAENLQALAAGRLRLRQRPGPDNALGLIKFLLPNAYDVYLHSTPARQLFAEPRRAFSHGCVRVGDPVALAVAVLRGTAGDWTAARIQAAMNGDTTFTVKLAQPVRVLILYATAVATEDGAVHFFDDIYGHDRQLEALLGLKPVTIAQ
jgi:L,D-transpeptidase YcbB